MVHDKQTKRRFPLRPKASLAAGVLAACTLILAIVVAPAALAPLPSPQATHGAAVPFPSVNEAQPAASGEQGEDPGDLSPSEAPSGASPDGAFPAAAKGEISAEHVPGVVIVRTAEDADAAQMTKALRESGCVRDVSVDEDDLKAGYLVLDLAEGWDVAGAMACLQELPEVAGSQPNYIYHLQDDAVQDAVGDGAALAGEASTADSGSASADSDEARQSAPALTLVSDEAAGETALMPQATKINDPAAGGQWALDAVGAYEAWDTVKAEGKVAVAVLDSGCRASHEDLKANIAYCYDAIEGKGAALLDNDDIGHGTNVAGVIAAEANNGVGGAGVSYNAGLVPVRVFGGNTSTSSQVVDGLRWILDNAARYNIRVINMSIGDAYETVDEDEDYLLIDTMGKAYRKGILPVCAACNVRDDTPAAPFRAYPVDWLDDALGVIAVDATGQRTSWSNYNVPGQTTKDLAAPGIGMYTTARNGEYATVMGTSFATPCVSGVAALVFALDPSMTPGKVANLLCDTATDLGAAGWDREYGAGRVNAAKAVKAVASYEGTFEVSWEGGKAAPPSVIYNGSAWKPKPTAVYYTGYSGVRTKLAPGSGYLLSYHDNVDAGTATVAIQGKKAGLLGSTSYTFKIAPLSLRSKSISVSVPACTYTGSALEPYPVVKFGSKTLSTWADYTVRGYKDNTKAGTGYVTIDGRKNFSGSLKLPFTIKKAGNPLKITHKQKRVSRSKVKKHAQKVSGALIVKGAKGKLSYAKVAKGSSKYLSVDKKTGKIIVKKGTKKGCYKIVVQVKAAGNANYKPASKKVTVKICVK